MSLTTSLSALLLLAAASYVQAADTFQTNLTTTGLITKDFSTFAIVDFPPCQYSGDTATLVISSKLLTPVKYNISVPQCRTRRAAATEVVLSDRSSGNTVVKNVGVRVENLSPNTNYSASYIIINKGVTGSDITFMTRSVQNDTDIPDTMARSGGMVVITVLLSIAMAILILGLVGTLVMSGK